MRSTRFPGWAARIVAGATVLLCASAPVGFAPVTGADPCPDVEVNFARGTSEPEGIGRVGQALTDALIPLVAPKTVGAYAVVYPASYDFLTAEQGAMDATAHITAMAQTCPSTRIVLGGYSQGAAVVDMLAAVPPLGDKIGDIGSGPPLPTALAPNVAAIAVFGNPSAKFSHPLNSSGLFAGRSIDLCADGDPICSRGRNPFAHTHYETSDFIPTAAAFVARFVR